MKINYNNNNGYNENFVIANLRKFSLYNQSDAMDATRLRTNLILSDRNIRIATRLLTKLYNIICMVCIVCTLFIQITHSESIEKFTI